MHEGELVSGKYTLIRCLGKGGMGEVWLAHHQLINRQVAIKYLHSDLLSKCTQEEIIHLSRKLGFIAQLNHPNIVRVQDFEPYQGSYFTVMDYFDGQNLHDFISRNYIAQNHFSEELIIQNISQILSALSAAHQIGIIHRNIKPSKIFIDKNGKAYMSGFIDAFIMDYHYLHNKRLIGKVIYQCVADLDKPSIASDLYSIGVIMYEMATGKPPFWDDREWKILIGLKPPKAPDEINEEISPKLNSIIMKAIRFRPEDRFQSAKEMADALEECQRG